jgi:MerR family transcriptional regulator, light-induced transcriptional regulator
VETLRTWEGRYGFPTPERKRSGHRVYPLSVVPHLKLVGEALRRGHRAGDVVGASEATLEALLLATAPPAGPPPPLPPVSTAAPTATPASVPIANAIALVRSYDAVGFGHELNAQWIARSPLAFLSDYLAPLTHAIGEGWATGELDVRHEHFFSARISDFLSAVRRPYDTRAQGPLAVLATLEGEAHTLGLQMCALVLAMSGYRVLYLGSELPTAQIVQAMREQAAPILGVSVAPSSNRSTGAALKKLRRRLPGTIAFLLGGAGAPELGAGFLVMRDLVQLAHWTRAGA